MVKTNSRGFNRSQVPNNSMPRQEKGDVQNNNIGVIQNFN